MWATGPLLTDPRTYFRAVALKGVCLLQLGRMKDVDTVLTTLIEITSKRSKEITYGDSFNFLDDLITNGTQLVRVRQLLESFLETPLSEDSKQRAESLRKRTLERLRVS